MDLTEELKQKIDGLDEHPRKEGIKAAIRHIKAAERHLLRGRSEEDSEVFNDVIYRTNQAFEGMLKEAYSVLNDKDGSKLSPHLIEKHLLESKKLGARVLKLFTNYRQDWRNPATHDHTLFFSDAEALLAIVSVSAFSVVLLDQIIETVNFKRERAEAERKRDAHAKDLAKASERSLDEHVLTLLSSFVSSRGGPQTEVELIGRISGHLVGLDPSIDVTHDLSLTEGYRADLLIERHGQKLLIEIKRGRPHGRLLSAATEQMGAYLAAAGLSSGIIYFSGAAHASARRVKEQTLDGGRKVWLLLPDEDNQ
jgi:hypothetical protein